MADAQHPRLDAKQRSHFTGVDLLAELVEVRFGIIERQPLHAGSSAGVPELNAMIRAFIDGWNDREPYSQATKEE